MLSASLTYLLELRDTERFEAIGGQCVFTSEWNKDAVRTYKANWFNDEQVHKFNLDIREVTLSDKTDVLETDAYAYIDEHVPDHDVLLAGSQKPAI